ncbi:hypothetical protein PRJ39_25835 [Lysobacter enzymogenes]|uniref:hypothetical protein n=1 Tax=Lysobacter enzymogenes TaxID=69 RepID=UPI0037493318
MSVQRIAEDRWSGAEPFWLCVLPWTSQAFERRWAVGAFAEYPDDGLGVCRAAVLRIGATACLAQAHPQGPPGCERVVLSVAADSADTRRDLDDVLRHLGLSESELAAVRPGLGPASWQLWRLDDNGNEFEMARFQTQGHAEWVGRQYQANGHRQTYFVRGPAAPAAAARMGEPEGSAAS